MLYLLVRNSITDIINKYTKFLCISTKQAKTRIAGSILKKPEFGISVRRKLKIPHLLEEDFCLLHVGAGPSERYPFAKNNSYHGFSLCMVAASQASSHIAILTKFTGGWNVY